MKEKSVFSHNLIRLRKTRGLTQKELAEKANLSQRMIVYYENEAGNPPIDKIKDIADALKVDIGDLLLKPTEKKKNDTQFTDEITNINTKTVKKIQQILALSPEDRHVVYSLVDSLSSKRKKQVS